jgi:hypothetical protein
MRLTLALASCCSAFILLGCFGKSDLVVLVDQSDPLVPVFDVDGVTAITTLVVDRCLDEECPSFSADDDPNVAPTSLTDESIEAVWRVDSSGVGHASDHPPTPVPLTYGVVPAAVYQGVYGLAPAGTPVEAPELTPGRYLVRAGRTDVAFAWGDVGFGFAEFDVE